MPMPDARLQRTLLLIFAIGAALAVPFILWPEIDMRISSNFYLPKQGFYMEFRPHYRAIYHLVTRLTQAVYVILIALILVKLLGRVLHRDLLKKISTRAVIYLSLVMAAGPWIGVHYVLKDGFERPRPREIVEFGGAKDFVPMLYVGKQKGSSFVSGHAAMGFYLAAFALLLQGKQRKVMYAEGLAAGAFIGLIRVIQGGHFASDVLFSGIFMLLVIHVCYAIVYRRQRA